MISMIKKDLLYHNRLGRKDFLFYTLVMVFILGLLAFIGAVCGNKDVNTIILILMVAFGAPFSIYLTGHRLHDIGMSRWACLIGLIPIVGKVFQLYLFFAPGQPGKNQYGFAPR